MITMLGSPRRCCDGLTRRETLKAGALSLLGGFTLPELLRAEELGARGKAKSVMLLFLLPLLTLALMAGFFAWSLMAGRDPASIGSVMVGRPAPKLEGLAVGDGKPRLVNFFASWCAPCLAEHPLFTRLKQRDGATIVGVAWKDKPEATRAWLARLGDPFSQLLFDPDGKTALDWGLSGVPETYLIDGAGIVRLHFRGPITEPDLTQRILPLLKGGS